MIKTFLLFIFISCILWITLPLFVAIALFGTLLWPIRAILYGIEKMFSKDKKEEDKKSNKLLEFIFLCYQIAGIYFLVLRKCYYVFDISF